MPKRPNPTLDELKVTMMALREGDRIAVTTRKYGRRELTVTADPRKSPRSEMVHVQLTSGRTMSSRERGGAITYWGGKDPWITYQPTIRQQAEHVQALEKIGVTNPSPRRRNLDKNRITRGDYPAVFGDTDRDEIPDVDDPHPTRPGDKKSIEEVRLADEMQALLDTRAEYVPVLDEMKQKLGDVGIRGASIKGRVKTPYSIINKLRRKRLGSLTDIAGAMMIVPDALALDQAAAEIERNFDVIERDDYYARPKDGYRALHYIVRIQGKPVELQLKTRRMAEIAKASHTAYKRGSLNAQTMDELGDLAAQADRGDGMAERRVDALLADKAALGQMLSRGGNPPARAATGHQRALARRLVTV